MGAQAASIGRFRSGLTAELNVAVEAIGLPLRIHPTPGQHGDHPQAEALLAGLQGVRHVIADAAYDADPLRADTLRATAQIKADSGRSIAPAIDWRLDKERHQVECFLNKLERFRRIALRCGKTLPTFRGFAISHAQ